MAKELFGTDGIRGVAGKYPLDAATIQAVGAALGRIIREMSSGAEVVLGIDTRESGPWIAAHLAGGLLSEQARLRYAGVITTPGIAYLARTGPFAAGVVISASHNPYQDNGIKIFDHSGYKLADQLEQRLEEMVFDLLAQGIRPAPVQLAEDPSLDEQYLEFLLSTFSGTLEDLRLVVDCANGAASRLAPELFRRLGAQIRPIHCSPNGRNINLNCGTLHLESLQAAVTQNSADLGLALDGDADRAIFVSRRGKVIDGDGVLLLAARFLLERGALVGPEDRPTVVSTVMSNLGLERALSRLGITMPRTAVGDKYVLEEMLRLGAVLGGEQSGHVIFLNWATTGDGLLTALRVLEIMRTRGQDLEELTADLVRFPQKLVNVRVRERRPLDQMPEVEEAIANANAAFGGAGRVLVRYSGTELLARVMIEGPDETLVNEHAERIAAAFERAIGATSGLSQASIVS